MTKKEREKVANLWVDKQNEILFWEEQGEWEKARLTQERQIGICRVLVELGIELDEATRKVDWFREVKHNEDIGD